ncbi:MAG TPA: hypothetical protein VKE73_03760 [Myxococcota bacterium]|nr:hypothetical protein [Myxococcota bacterium]
MLQWGRTAIGPGAEYDLDLARGHAFAEEVPGELGESLMPLALAHPFEEPAPVLGGCRGTIGWRRHRGLQTCQQPGGISASVVSESG